MKQNYYGEGTDMKLYKVGQSRLIAGMPTLAYGETYLSLKTAKLENIKHLLTFVTADTEWFKRTLAENNSTAVMRPALQDETDEKIDSDTDVYE